jgi:hypothetical protein
MKDLFAAVPDAPWGVPDDARKSTASRCFIGIGIGIDVGIGFLFDG